MFYHKEGNLNLRFKLDGHDDLLGEMYMKIPEYYASEFFTEYCVKDANVLEYLDDDEKWTKGDFITTNPDLAIAFFSWAIKHTEIVSVEATYSDRFWALHDILHAINDEAFCTVTVSADTEEARFRDTFDLMIEKGYDWSYTFVEELESAFYNRFNRHCDLSKYYPETEYL